VLRLAIVLAGCSTAVSAPAPPAGRRVRPNGAPPLAVAGELLEYKVKLRGIAVGTVQTAIGQPGVFDGKRAIVARSRGKTDGVLAMIGSLTWELETTIDLDTGYPIHDREHGESTFAGKTEREQREHVWQDGEHRHDVHSAVAALRAWRSRPSEQNELDVRVAGAHFDVAVWEAERALLHGTPAVRYEGKAHGVPVAAWISDDAQRVPLALRARSPLGELTVELVEYEVPRE
jgi:hypothetical protein